MRALLPVITDALRSQVKPVIDRARSGQLTNELIDTLTPTGPISEVVLEIYSAVGADFAESVFEGLSDDKAGTPKLEVKRFERDSYQHNVEGWLTLNGTEKVVAITETTKKTLKAGLAKFIEAGADIDEMAAFIDAHVAATYAGRARTIARTETISASNYGAMEGANMTGLDLNKEWISTFDDRTREDHLDVDGQTVDKDAPFRVGGEELSYPADFVNGSPANTINCRCTVAFIKKV